ncbi:MAG TPA: dihydrolipoamide acetyltransferase family protein [Xanthomonadales bacterium]|nr:dihydrolipoamide acetyltransferase family protein [Xanthomonadales bacterium]
MADMKLFHLPDLGEGLPDAEIVEWHVKEGEKVKLDAPLVSMETAKAVVDVPSPYTGTIVKLFGKAGDVIETGAPLAGFELEAGAAQRAEAEPTGHHHAPPASKGAGRPVPDEPSRDDGGATTLIASDEGGEILAEDPHAKGDAGTVVGAMEASDRVVAERTSNVGGVKAVPAVRALAKKLGVDLSRVKASGAGGVITIADVKAGAAAGLTRPAVGGAGAPTAQRAAEARTVGASAPPTGIPEARSQAGKPMRTVPHSVRALGQPEQVKGVRRNMARVMADSHAKVVPTTIFDDADIHAWRPGNDIMARLVRALVVASRAVPELNAWFDGDAGTRTLHQRVDVGIAVDTEDGLFVPALRNADVLDAAGIRAALNRIRDQVRDRTIPAEELKGYTLMLSNFGMFAGRYATPVIVPPCVAIVAAGKLMHRVVPVMGAIETHRMIPISLTFDHRAATGGEAARFLRAMLDDLGLAA